MRAISLLIVSALLLVPSLVLAEEDKGDNQPPEGFQALFNGKDLTGWKGLVGNPKSRAEMSPEALAEAQKAADKRMRRHWKIEGGIIIFDGRGDNLVTEKDYGDFELYVDWKIEKEGDSGIYLRGTPQVQIWDPALRNVGSGGLFNNKENPSEPLTTADNPVGQWNTFYIKMVGDKVTVKLNDQLVVDNVVMENYWERDKPIYPTGPVELQNHGNTLYFRNIYIRELPTGEKTAGTTSTASDQAESGEEEDWTVLFGGKDLSQWDYKEDGWVIAEDGSLTVKQPGKAGYIWSEDRYGDFVLELEFKMSPDCNSGVFFRTDSRENWLHTGIEMQIFDSHGKENPGKHDCGAIYDVMAPSVNAAKPPGQWNHVRITAKDNLIDVVLNDQHIIDMDLNRWTEPHQNPDDSRNKFNTAYKDMKREGFIGFQDHGHPVWFRNVRIKPQKE